MTMLQPSYFERADESTDEQFYRQPRFVTHIDDAAIAAVTQLYRDYFPADGAILDLMSSWVSHLPPEIAYQRVAATGMNEAELKGNPRLTEYVVQNLNANPILPFADNSFDGAAICVSVQYLTQPVPVFREIGRVLKPGAPLVVSFSNRCFPTKAVAIWQSLDDRGHCRLVERYFHEAATWDAVTILDGSPRRWGSDPLFAVVGRKTELPPPRT